MLGKSALKSCIDVLSAGAGRSRFPRTALLPAVLAAVLAVAGCQSTSQSPQLESDYVGRSSAAFFEAYGPPDQVIGLDQALKKDATGKIVTQDDPKQLVYYWSSTNPKTYSKVPKPAGDSCTLAILTSAGGTILRIEVQDENDNIAAVKARCEALIQ
ncbi:hypothetical protein WNZ15_04425 [Roseibium sp. AS2]|uniref:hypothetical protein n=1 Tax=Roseibium sp. AS2 TaxID=3135781 RepID=UPI003171BDDD